MLSKTAGRGEGVPFAFMLSQTGGRVLNPEPFSMDPQANNGPTFNPQPPPNPLIQPQWPTFPSSLSPNNPAFPVTPSNPSIPLPTQNLHPQVFCDNCVTFIGTRIRYKCLDCVDFDVCDQCEPGTTLQHFGGRHLFMKIRDSTVFGQEHINSYCKNRVPDQFNIPK